MTLIIAHRDDTSTLIAADGLVTADDRVWSRTDRKLYRVGDTVIGLCGHASLVTPLLDCDLKDYKRPSKLLSRLDSIYTAINTEGTLLVARPDGVWLADVRPGEPLAVVEQHTDVVAIGSGDAFALGYLAAHQDKRAALEGAFAVAARYVTSVGPYPQTQILLLSRTS